MFDTLLMDNTTADKPNTRTTWLERCINRGRVERFFEERDVTPELAMEMLSHNVKSKNRPLSDARVQRYVGIIEEGRWMLTSESIAFDQGGRLQDGQHRLTAIVRTGITTPCTIAFGRDRKEFEVIDQGLGRAASHLIAIEGIADYNHVGAMAALLYRISSRETRIPSPQVILETARKMHRGKTTAALAAGDQMKTIAGKTAAAMAHYYINTHSQKADLLPEFWEKFIDAATPSMLATRDTISTLRARRMDVKDRSMKIAALLILAWNAHVSKKSKATKTEWKHIVYLPDVI